MIPLVGALVKSGLSLVGAIVEHLPEPDPELRRKRMELRDGRRRLAMEQAHAERMARITARGARG